MTHSYFKSKHFPVFCILAVVFTVFGFLHFFQKIDYRMYDFMLALHREPKQNEKILFCQIDDKSIQAIGEWPWTRDVMADALLRLKELGARLAVFDVEYLSPSAKGIAPNANAFLNSALSQSKADIAEVVSELSAGVSNGFISKSELPHLSHEMLENYINPSLDNMAASVSNNMYRDNDEYFGKAIGFFGNAFLTINTRDVAIEINDEDKAYAEKRMLYTNVVDKNNYTAKDNVYASFVQGKREAVGFAPALHILLSKAKGAGFTNVSIDEDGTRRRIELLYDYGGKYAAQLAFSPLLQLLDVEKIERKKYSLVLHNALLPGSEKRETISIPLDEHGRMLINWLHKDIGHSFKNESLVFLHDLDSLEGNIEIYLQNISQNQILDKNGNPLSYIKDAKALLDSYAEIVQMKNYLLDRQEGFDENNVLRTKGNADDFERYFSRRQDFFAGVKKIVESDHENEIEARLSVLQKQGLKKDVAASIKNLLSEQFGFLKDDFTLYTEYFSDMKKNYDGAYCFIGNTATSTTDLGTNPFLSAYANVGTHANVMNTILQRDFISVIPQIIGLLFAIFVMFLVSLFTYEKTTGVQNLAGGISVVALIVLFLALMVFFGIYVPVVAPAFFSVFAYVSGAIIRFVKTDREKRFLRNAFSTYLSKDVVNEIIADPAKLHLGGEEKHMTALFTDIKSFSTFSERVSPEELVSVLNVYLGALSDRILAEGGTIDKYIGDAIVSFFGAPLEMPDHAYKACVAAIKMKQAESAFNEKYLSEKRIPWPLQTRIGINTGNMVVGNMGTDIKMNYTVMGNNVNLASRLEGVNKQYHSWILASDETWKEANEGHEGELVGKKFDKVRVVGITEPVQLWTILGFKKDLASETLQGIGAFHDALSKYVQRDFTSAYKIFHELYTDLHDESAGVFAERCKAYAKNGVDELWDGVMNLTSK